MEAGAWPFQGATPSLNLVRVRPSDAFTQLIVFALERQDFVTEPKPNGYQSIHTNVQLADGRVIEIQIRTRAMHERAESGSASHDEYRAQQLGGGLALLPSSVKRTSLALRGVQAAVRDDSKFVAPVLVPLLPAASSSLIEPPVSLSTAIESTAADVNPLGPQ